MATVQEFADLVLAQTQEQLRTAYPTSPQWEWERVSVKPGPKYTKVDVGPEHNMSGKYMIDNETGVIYGIKGYGKVHKGHTYGTLDTVDQWYWGGYVGEKLPPKPEPRKVMGRAELAGNHVRDYGRDYSESDDGYSDMEAEQGRGWKPISAWGRDGWDLGQWPYVVIYTRSAGDAGSSFVVGKRHELMVICEGDRSVYAFASEADRSAAIDYLFLWHSADQDWSPVTWETREQLDNGQIEVGPKFRGPFSWKRAEAEREHKHEGACGDCGCPA